MTSALSSEHFGTHSFGGQPTNLREPAWPPRQAENPNCRRIVDAAVDILRQGEALLGTLTVETYTTKLPVVFNGSIGGHYRHCLDHFASLVRGLDAGLVDYDHRERDPRLEQDPEFALGLTCQLRTTLELLEPGTLAASVSARSEVSYDHGDSPVTGSSVGRELAYAIAHAIHHYALISVMARLLNATLPPHFGIAPSTVAHQKTAASH